MWSTGYFIAVDNKVRYRFSHSNWGVQTENYRRSIKMIQPHRWTKIFEKAQDIISALIVPGIIELNSDVEGIPDSQATICELTTESEGEL